MFRPSCVARVLLGCPTGSSWPVRLARAPLRLVLWVVLRTGLRVGVEGTAVAGPAVVVSNHPNLLDGLLVLLADASLRPIARWHRHPVVRLGLWIGNCVITSTGTAARRQRGAYAGALAHLRAGGRVWIAPEGGWQPELTLRPPRTGAVRLASAASVPIQLLAIEHLPHPGPDVSRLRAIGRRGGSSLWQGRPHVVLRWGPRLRTTGDVAADSDRLMATLGAATGMTWASPAPAVAPSAERVGGPPSGRSPDA